MINLDFLPRYPRFPLAVVMFFAMASCGHFRLAAADYYIDPAGNDANAGTSPAAPWRSLAKVNGTVFQPGDNVLFKRGGTWVGTLSPQGSGTSVARITLGTYGEGAKPQINGNGNWAVITLSTQDYWTIDGFEVTNPAGNDSSRSGIRIDYSGGGTMRGIEILNNDVHNVRGIKNVNDGGRNNGGIFFWINEPGKADGVLIQGNTVKNIHGQGIAFNAEAEYAGGGMNYANCSPNVVARGNTVMTTSGDGILMLGTDNELVEFNEVGYVGHLSDWYNNIAAAWPTRHVNGVWQYNEVHNTAALNANDSTAFDNDGFVKGTTVFQYNVTYNNAGGFLMEYTWGGDDPSARTVARYNISWNESRILATNRNNARIYNNVFYNPGATIDVSWTPNPSYVLFSNNLFVAAGRTGDFSRQLFINNSFSGGVDWPTNSDGNVVRNPLFVSPNTTGNLAGFILQSGSPERNSGFIIDGSQGKDFWGVTLPATAPHRGASQINSIGDYAATPTYLRLEGPDSVEIPATGTTTAAFVPILRDQNFRRIASPSVTWSVSPAVAGVSIDSSGTLSIASTAMPKRIAVQATNGSASASYSVALFTNQPLNYTWGGGNGSWTDTSASGWNGGPPSGTDHATINSGSVDVNVVGVGNLGSLTLGGGTLFVHNFNAGLNTYTAYNNLFLHGGTLHGYGNYNNWGAGILKNPVVSGTTTSTISSSSFFNLNGTGASSSVFNVADVTGDASADLNVSARLADVSADQSWLPGALVKSGAGTMRLTNINTFTGGTTVEEGTLEIAGAAGGTGLFRGAVTVNAGATLALTGGDGTGFGWQDQISSIAINGGMITNPASCHVWNIPGGITMTGGTLQSNNGTSDPNGPQLEWNRTSVATLASPDTATIGGRIRIRGDAGYAGLSFDVADGAAATDLLVSAAVTEASGGLTLTKSGAGKLVLSGTNSYSGGTTVNGGTMVADTTGTLGSGNLTVNTGATCEILRPSGAIADTATITLNGTGKLTLADGVAETVQQLFINGVLQPMGSYTSASSFVTGGGTLVVTTGAPTGIGNWTSLSNGNWSVPGNWQNGTVADGADNSATFAQSTGVIVTLDGNRTIGGLVFANANYTIAGSSTLTLDVATGMPTVDVSASRIATLGMSLAGSDGLQKIGGGKLALTGSIGYTGATRVLAGTLESSGNGSIGNLQVNGIGAMAEFTAGTATVASSGGDTYLTGGGVLEIDGGSLVIQGGAAWFSVGDHPSVPDGNGTLTLTSGTFTNSNSWGITVGEGNAGTGTININGGIFTADDTINHNGIGLGLAAGGNGTLNLNGGTLIADRIRGGAGTGTLNFNGGKLQSTGDNNDLLPANGNLASSVLTGGLTVGGTPDFTLSDGLAGNGGLLKEDANRATLAGVNTYAGGTVVNGGTLELAGASGGTSLIRGVVSVNSGAALTLTGGDGSGFGWSNTISHLNVNGGKVNAIGGAHIGFGSYVNVAMTGGGTISGNWQWNGDSLLGFSSSGDSTNTISGALVLRADAGANHTFSVADGAADVDLQINAALTDQSPEIWWVSASALVKTGPGKLVLAGANSYDGQTDIQSGMLAAANSTALGAGGWNGATMTWIKNGATLALQGGVSLDEHFHIWGSGVGGLGALRSLSGSNALTLTFNGSGNGPGFALRSNTTVGVDADTLSVTGFYEHEGSWGITKVGAGTLKLTTSSTYTGGTIVDDGTLLVDTAGTIGSGNLTVNDGATCEIRNPTGAMAETADIHLSGTGMLILASGVSVTVDGLYVDGVKQGPGVYTAGSLAAHLSGDGSLNVLGGPIDLTAPVARQVVQRNGSGTGSIVVSGSYSGNPESIEARAVVMAGTGNNGTTTDWTTIVPSPAGGTFNGTLGGVAAGGWYQIEVRAVTGGVPSAFAAIIQRVGVGDVYLTAGQSNSANWGAPGVNTDDRVSAMNYADGTWSLAADPMPGADGTLGSVWTRLGTLLTSSANVPVGFVCVGVGGTPVSFWVPPSAEGYLKLKAAAQAFPANGFRAVLWHQGESDALASTTSAAYQASMESIIAQLRTDSGWSMPWYLAEVSFHPGSTLAQEEPVVAGQRRVIYGDPLVFAGPVTDDFHHEGKLSDTVHFNDAGMLDHAQQWAQVLTDGAPLAPKNGDIESNAALSDGGITVVNMGDVSSPSIIGWRILNASGDAVADGANGYFNPDVSFYGPAALDTTGSGGVLPNMSGRHVAFFYGGSAGNHFLQTRRATLQPNTTYTLTVALGVRGIGGIHGNARLEILADGVSLASREVTQAELDSLNGGNAVNTFTDMQLTCQTGATVAEGQALAIRITKVAGLIGGNPTYLDFDNVRLTSSVAPGPEPSDYDTWKSASGVAGGPDDDDDNDGQSNRFEYAFGQSPLAPSGNPVAFLTSGPGPNLTYTRRKLSLTGLNYSVWTSTNLTGWTEDTGAVQTASAIPGTDNESVEIALSPALMSAGRLFIRIEVR